MKTTILLLAALFSLNALAVETQQSLEGVGIDGEACRIEITRDGNLLKKVEIKGAAEVFEILAERGSSYGPSREIRSHGGEEIVDDSPEFLQAFRHSENFFSEGETFSVDTSDLPQTEESMGGLKMQIAIALKYDRGQLVSATVTSKAKALLIATLASSKFTCQK